MLTEKYYRRRGLCVGLRILTDSEAVFKLLFLALRNIAKKWTMPVQNWKAALNRFAIVYENRLPADQLGR